MHTMHQATGIMSECTYVDMQHFDWILPSLNILISITINTHLPEWFEYRIAGNFRGVQFSRKASLQSFRGLIFADARTHSHYTLYNRAYFAGLIFADSSLSAKTAKIEPNKNFPLYSILQLGTGTV